MPDTVQTPYSSYSDADRERYIRAAAALAQKMDPDDIAQFLGTLTQNTRAMDIQAQKATQEAVKEVLRGIYTVDASAQRGVNAESIRAWTEYQRNLVRLQEAGANVNRQAIQAATAAANNTQRPSTTDEWKKAFWRELTNQLGSGADSPFLFGTINEALRLTGMQDKNADTVYLAFSDAFGAGSVGQVNFQALLRNFQDQAVAYEGVSTELAGLNDVLRNTRDMDNAQLAQWYAANGDQWQRFLNNHDNFARAAKPYLTSDSGAFYVDLKATLAPEFESGSAMQKAILEGVLQGASGAGTGKPSAQDRMARFISSPGAQRMAEQYGFQVGHVIPVTAENKEKLLAEYPNAVYSEQLGGLYVPGPDDRRLVDFAHRRLTARDPRGTVGQQIFGRKPATERTFMDIEEKREGSTPTSPPKVAEYYDFRRYDEKKGPQGAVYVVLETGQIFRIDAAGEKKGKLQLLTEGEKIDLKTATKKWPQTRVSEPTPEQLEAAGVPEAFWKPGSTGLSPDRLAHVEVVPNRLSDPVGSIRIIDPNTGEFRLILPENVVSAEVVGGGGQRQDIRAFIGRVRAMESQRAGAEAAQRSKDTAEEHPERTAYKDDSAVEAAESLRPDAPKPSVSTFETGELEQELPPAETPKKKETDEERRAAEEAVAPTVPDIGPSVGGASQEVVAPSGTPRSERVSQEELDAASRKARGVEPAPAPAPTPKPPAVVSPQKKTTEELRQEILQESDAPLLEEHSPVPAPSPSEAPAGTPEVPFSRKLPGLSPQKPAAPSRPEGDVKPAGGPELEDASIPKSPRGESIAAFFRKMRSSPGANPDTVAPASPSGDVMV